MTADHSRWGIPRYSALLAVLMFHAVLIGALWMTSTRGLPAPAADSVQLLFLPPVNLPKVRSQNSSPRPAGVALAVAPPLLVTPPFATAPAPASSTDGTGTGVDWAAEARRALQAFEIRNRQPRPIRPADENWWPQSRHRAGEQFKTANGDWIVWINSNCYQVASSGASTYALGSTLPRTVCLGQSAATR